MMVKSSIGSVILFFVAQGALWVRERSMVIIGGHTLSHTRGTLGHKTTLHQFLSHPVELLGFYGLRFRPRHKAVQPLFQRYQGLKPEPPLDRPFFTETCTKVRTTCFRVPVGY